MARLKVPFDRHTQVGELEDLLLVLVEIAGERVGVVADQLDRDPLDVRLADVAHAGGADPGRGYNPNRRNKRGAGTAEKGTVTPAIRTNTLAEVFSCVPHCEAIRGGFQAGD